MQPGSKKAKALITDSRLIYQLMQKKAMFSEGHVTPASTSDTTELEQLIEESDIFEGSSIFADKGYASEKNRSVLINRKLKDGIMNKASRNKSLTSPPRFA